MITKLTKTQEDSMKKFVSKYVSIGLANGEIDSKSLKTYVTRLYKFMGRNEPKSVIVMPGPYYSWIATCILSVVTGKKEVKEVKEVKLSEDEQNVLKLLTCALGKGKTKNWDKILLANYDSFKELLCNYIYPYLDGQLFATYILPKQYRLQTAGHQDMDKYNYTIIP